MLAAVIIAAIVMAAVVVLILIVVFIFALIVVILALIIVVDFFGFIFNLKLGDDHIAADVDKELELNRHARRQQSQLIEQIIRYGIGLPVEGDRIAADRLDHAFDFIFVFALIVVIHFADVVRLA